MERIGLGAMSGGDEVVMSALGGRGSWQARLRAVGGG
jgi:hypothetical protein